MQTKQQRNIPIRPSRGSLLQVCTSAAPISLSFRERNARTHVSLYQSHLNIRMPAYTLLTKEEIKEGKYCRGNENEATG